MLDIWGIAAILAKLALYVGITGAAGIVLVRIAFSDLVGPLHAQIRRLAFLSRQ